MINLLIAAQSLNPFVEFWISIPWWVFIIFGLVAGSCFAFFKKNKKRRPNKHDRHDF